MIIYCSCHFVKYMSGMLKRLQPGFISGLKEPLCCCEYINMHGEKTHILGICCDCEALDETFDK